MFPSRTDSHASRFVGLLKIRRQSVDGFRILTNWNSAELATTTKEVSLLEIRDPIIEASPALHLS